MGKYRLKCVECGSSIPDNYTLRHQSHDSLLRAEYIEKRFATKKLPGIWRFINWLPIEKHSEYDGTPVTFRSIKLARELKLKNLFISFNGYFPEKKCYMMTSTFKELEAPPSIQRAAEKKIKKLVVASAGNTARAFAYTAKYAAVEIYLVVPESCSDTLWLPEECSKNVHLISLSEKYDYTHAIQFSEKLSTVSGFTSEGGARNIARRDGMGTVLLEAISKIKRMPAHYFQAVGSGTGAIAVWESAIRLENDSRFGNILPQLHLSQNAPFTPMVNAWQNRRRKIIQQTDMPKADQCIKNISAKVLSNRNPPYGIIGGVYDALKSTNGDMYSITNKEAMDAGRLFESTEEIDVAPAAKVAIASLEKAIDRNVLKHDESVLLNITGCGEKRLKEEKTTVRIKSEIKIKDINTPIEEILEL